MFEKNINVLIVDDEDEAWVNGLARYLETDRDRVFICNRAESVNKAKLACAQQTPDVVVLDLKLDGATPNKELLEWMPSRFPKTAIILVTDTPSVPITADWMALRRDEFFCKSDEKAYEKVKDSIERLAADNRQVTVDEIVESLASWGRVHGEECVLLKCGGEELTAKQLADHVRHNTPIGRDYRRSMLERAASSLRADSVGEVTGEAKGFFQERMAAFMELLDKMAATTK